MFYTNELTGQASKGAAHVPPSLFEATYIVQVLFDIAGFDPLLAYSIIHNIKSDVAADMVYLPHVSLYPAFQLSIYGLH
jgi:hypothetical protein